MRFIKFGILSLVVALFATACDPENNNVIYTIIAAESTGCSYDEQILDINYTLTDNLATPEDESAVEVAVVCNQNWITNIDTSTHGILRLSIAENLSEIRTAKLTITAFGHAKTTIEVVQLSAPPQKVAHTLFIYFSGTSLSRYFNYNIEDASKAIADGATGENCRVIFFRQTSKSAAYIGELCYNPKTNECVERHIQDVTIDPSRFTPEMLAANISTMAEYAPAERYGMVLAGHGQGWVTREVLNGSISHTLSTVYNPWTPSFGAEVTRAFGENNVQMDIIDLAQGIEQADIDIDYILFDACFMANIEAIYDLRNAANYIIASPCEIMGRGFPYHHTLHYLLANDGESTDYVGAAESYYKYYRDEYANTSRCGSVAVFDCHEVEAVADRTRDIMATALNSYDTEHLQTYEGQNVHTFYDFGQWAKVVATDNEAYDSFKQQLNRMVIAKFTLPTFYSAYGTVGTYEIDTEVYSGITTSAPSQAYPIQWHETSWYRAISR